MEETNKERLRYRRQYLITPRLIDCPFLHQRIKIGHGYYLYSHIDLQLTEYHINDVRMILLGDMFDFEVPGKTNLDILKDLSEFEFNNLLEHIGKYTGRFVFLFQNSTDFKIVNDATTTRKVYYCQIENDIWCSSQAHLMANVLKLKHTSNDSKLKYYNSKDFSRLDNANIGDTTYYDEIRQLMPNHYFDVSQFTVLRFWPIKRIKYQHLDVVAEKCAKIIKGYMESIATRYDVMLPVTAGNDTRLLLSATNEFQNRVYYYINKDPQLTHRSPDIRIPKKLFKKLNSEFHIIDSFSQPSADFKEVFFENNPLASKRYLPHIYNYYQFYQDKVNLPGNFAAAPWGKHNLLEKNVTGENLAILYELSEYQYAIDSYTEWLANCYDLCKVNNIELVRLFYWEERIGNWGTHTQLDKDIAQEDINPFNSRLIISLFYSVKSKYNEGPDFRLHGEIIKRLWPELLKVPRNPSFVRLILLLLKKFGLLRFLYFILHKNMR